MYIKNYSLHGVMFDITNVLVGDLGKYKLQFFASLNLQRILPFFIAI